MFHPQTVMSSLSTYLFDKQDHTRQEIDRVQLYRNRLVKSAFILPLLITAFTLNAGLIYATSVLDMPGTISVNILQVYFVVTACLGLIFMPYHHKHYGYNLNALRFNLITGILLGLAGLTGSLFFRISNYRAGLSEYGFHFNLLPELFRLISCIIFSFCQEAVSKGIFQSYFVAIFEETPYRKLLAILLASLVFAQFHLLYGFGIVAITFVYSLFSGIYYEKTRSLVGVFIIHFMSGAGIFFFSGLY